MTDQKMNQPDTPDKTADANPASAVPPSAVPGPSRPAEPKPAAPRNAVPRTVPFGRIDEQGRVFVQDGETEREVGQYPDGVPEDPFALYVRRFLDLEATVNLFEARLPTLPPKDIDLTVSTLTEQLQEPAVVGDIPSLRARFEKLKEAGEARKAEAREERKAARAAALVERTAIVEEAEAIAAQPSGQTQWKNSGARLRELLEAWKEHQRAGVRLDKPSEDALWKRFSAARTTFDRGRRQYFSELDAKQKEAKEAKEALIVQATALQNSDDWRATSAAYRDLMEQWKRAGRASRREDDELWARFRAAQQVFFDSRREHDRVTNEGFAENLAKKQELAAEAERLLPVRDLEKAKRELRSIQDRWEDIGRVSARDSARIEQRLKAVEREVREAEQREWRRSDPETKARAEGMLSQLEESIADLKSKLAAAEAKGDAKQVKEISSALATKQMWFDQISSSVE